MWGPEAPERHVLVDGKILQVRDNIWRCLKHLRDHNLMSSRLWIDAICINQNDEEEKNKQVAMMRDIFRRASRVLIWLGSTSMQIYLHDSQLNLRQYRLEDLSADNVDTHIDVMGHSDPRSISLENQIMSIVYNLYWRRLWIIQEVMLAQEACIIFGKSLLEQTQFFPIYEAARKNSKLGFHGWIQRQTDPNIENLGTGILDHHAMLCVQWATRSRQDAHQPETLGELVRDYHRQSCTDSRDYVYGLIGLLDTAPRITVDYALAKEEVAVQALQHLDYEANRALKLRKERHGTDLCAAKALIKALSVTSSSYLECTQTRSGQKVRATRESSLRFSLSFFSSLATANTTVWPGTRSYKHAYNLHVSGRLTKTLYEMKKANNLVMKRLDGQITQFTYATRVKKEEVGPEHPERNQHDVVQCCLHTFPALLLHRGSKGGQTIEVKHFIGPDTTREIHEASLSLEIQLPAHLRAALQREINACGVSWDDLRRGVNPTSFLRLSVYETISLCELITP